MNRGELIWSCWCYFPDENFILQSFLRSLCWCDDGVEKLQRMALEHKCVGLYVAAVEEYSADVCVETNEGWNIAMVAAKCGNLDLLKWALEKEGGGKLLYHKTYNGKTFWDFAQENKNGAIMNFVRDYRREVGNGSDGCGFGRKDVRTKHRCGSGKGDYHKTPNFDWDLMDPNSRLYALMIKKGYAGRPQAFAAVAKNPNNELYLILKGMGYFGKPTKR